MPERPEAEFAYWELRLEIARLLPIWRQFEEQGEVGPLLDAISVGLLEYLLDHRCAKCGRELLSGLLGYICFPAPDYAHVCPVCYAETVQYRHDRGARHAQLAMLARQHPGLVAAPLAALLERNGETEAALEARLGGGMLGLARLALAPMPREDAWETDIADLARWTGCEAQAIADVLREAASPPPALLAPLDREELPRADDNDELPF